MRLLPLLPLLVATAACGPGRRVEIPVQRLAEAADTVTLQDTELGDAVPLGGERWAVLAPLARTVRVVDFVTRRAAVLGRPGRDYAEPSTLFRVGDTLFVGDWGLRRVTAWSLDGKLLASIPVPDAFGGAIPRGRDAAGHWYAERRPKPGQDGSGNLDSGAVVRLVGTVLDTVAQLAPYAMQRVAVAGAQRYERLVLSGTDQWGVRPDGSVWVARVNDNRVDVCAPGARCTSGPTLPDLVLEVTLEDRQYFLQGFPEEHRSLAEDLPFALVKPPFSRGFAAPDGALWLEKSRALSDTLRGYVLLDPTGTPLREYRLPNAQRILGASDSTLLAVDPLVPGPGHRVVRYRRAGG